MGKLAVGSRLKYREDWLSLVKVKDIGRSEIKNVLCFRDCEDGEPLISSARWRIAPCGVVIGAPDVGRARQLKTITKWN